MAWIESHQAIKDHPKTRKLARLLGVSIPAAIGHLHCLWWWALEYAQDGDLQPFDNPDIAGAALWDGDADPFIFALCSAGFLDGGDGSGGVWIHDWMDYAGRLVEIRRRKAESMRALRASNVPVTSSHVPLPTVPNRTVPNRTSSTKVEEATFEYPEWFNPLVDLKGFKRTAHKGAIKSIREASTDGGVTEQLVVELFVAYYRDGGRSANGWSDPVAALVRTLPIQVRKAREYSPRASPPEVDPLAKQRKFMAEMEEQRERGIASRRTENEGVGGRSPPE